MNVESITIVVAMALFFMAMVTIFDNANKK